MRLAVAKDAGLDEDTIADAARVGGDLSSRHQAARNLADAQMTQPGMLSEDEVAALTNEFSVAELVELTLDVMKWNYQKVSVALGTDGEVRPGELVALSFDEGGSAVLD